MAVLDTLEHWCDTVIEDLAGAGNAILASYEIANALSLLCMWMEPVVSVFTVSFHADTYQSSRRDS